MNAKPSFKTSFFAELQRLHVYEVGAMYATAGGLLVQVVSQVFPIFDISVRWLDRPNRQQDSSTSTLKFNPLLRALRGGSALRRSAARAGPATMRQIRRKPQIGRRPLRRVVP